MFQVVIQLGVFEKSLRRNTAPVEAGSTSALFLNACDAFTKLSSANGANISGRAAANDKEIVG